VTQQAFPRSRRSAWGTVAALLLLFGAACGRGGGDASGSPTSGPRQVAAPLEPVRVLYPAASVALLPYWAGDAAGGFARNGLRLELSAEPDVSAALGRLSRGEIEVYLTPLTPALVAQAADVPDLTLLGGTPELSIVTTRRLLGTREFIFERFLRGVLEGIHTVQTQPDLVRQILIAQADLPTAADADQAARAYLVQGGAARVPYLAPTDVEAAIAGAARPDPLDADRLLDQSLLRRLEASGFVDGLYRA
jgi:ABC-type nitrate/sulfonate/bicarbonate transport system substrate-binding protein